MSDEAVLVEFMHYNAWANAALLQACEALVPEQLAATVPGTYGTLARTLEHLVDSEAFYYRLLTGEQLAAPFQWEAGPTVAQIRTYYDQVSEAMIGSASRMRPDDTVHDRWEGGEETYQALALFIQIVDHGVEHRTNITTILSALGLPAPVLDGWHYLKAHPERLEFGQNRV